MGLSYLNLEKEKNIKVGMKYKGNSYIMLAHFLYMYPVGRNPISSMCRGSGVPPTMAVRELFLKNQLHSQLELFSTNSYLKTFNSGAFLLEYPPDPRQLITLHGGTCDMTTQ